MTEDEFFVGLDELSLHFDRKMKPQLSQAIYQRLRGHRKQDWIVAVENMVSDPERRMLPRTGEILQALSMALSTRIRREDNQRKLDEREAYRKLADHPELEGIGLILQRLPFPPALRSALSDKLEGRITQFQLDQICRDWTPPDISVACLCDDGFMSYKQSGAWYTGACAACGMGRIKPAAFPRVDPKTLAVVSRGM